MVRVRVTVEYQVNDLAYDDDDDNYWAEVYGAAETLFAYYNGDDGVATLVSVEMEGSKNYPLKERQEVFDVS